MSFFSPALPAAIAAMTAIPVLPVVVPAPEHASGIIAARDGAIYFADSYHRTVWRVVPGQPAIEFVSGRDVRALQEDESGNIYGMQIESRGRLVLWRADRQGRVFDVARCEASNHTGHAFLIDDNGELVNRDAVLRRTDIPVSSIGGMTRTDDGAILFTAGAAVHRIGADGRVMTVVEGERALRGKRNLLARLFGGSSAHLTGIATDVNGTIYVANSARGLVAGIAPDGRVRTVFASEGGWTPTGVAAANGAIYVLEYGPGVRVRRIADDGDTVVAAVRASRTVAVRTLFADPLLMPS